MIYYHIFVLILILNFDTIAPMNKTLVSLVGVCYNHMSERSVGVCQRKNADTASPLT